MNQENNINLTQDNRQLSKTNLSFSSLILTILQIVMSSIPLPNSLSFLGQLPYITVALILAIISKCKYNDKLSLVMIIVDAVLIGISIIVFLIAILFVLVTIESIATGCSGVY